jgi:diguanylate cyclase (GGDEF)-like protein/PAS domain S-box-containing protein
MIIFDITPYKRIEEMLSNTVEETQRLPDYKRSECLHRGRSYELVSILDNLDIQVWNLCDGETYGLVNKAHAEFLGSSKSEIENKSIFYFWPQDDALFLQDMNRQALEKKERLSVKRLIHTSNGGEYLFRLSFCPQFTDSGNLETIICSAEDITEYEQSKQEIQKNQEMLTSQSFCDELTGIPNRRCFNDVLKKEWGRSKRLASPLSILLADIDHFKEFNDTYGHLAGDECLKKVANVLMNSIQRSTDFVARFGGEEFIVILPNTTLDGAICMAEKMRKLVQFQKIRHINSHVTDVVTISIGVGHMVPLVSLQDIDEQKLLYAADQALYKAKNNGRNQVEYIDVRCDGSRKEISSDTI